MSTHRVIEEEAVAVAAGLKLQEPVAWMKRDYIYDDDRDRRPIGMDEPQFYWGKEPPEETGWYPLYALPLSPGDSKSESEVQTAHPVVAVGTNLQAAPTNTAEAVLTNRGVFKGAHGLRGLMNAREFWDKQPYCTRLYYGDGIADYLHINVLQAAVECLDAMPVEARVEPSEAIGICHACGEGRIFPRAHTGTLDGGRKVPLLSHWCDHCHGIFAGHMESEANKAIVLAACEASADARPTDEKAPVSAVAEALQDPVKFFWDNRQTAGTQALRDVMAERYRQMMVEGWTAKHDDQHNGGAMTIAAAAYALSAHGGLSAVAEEQWARTGWSWAWFKPKDPRRDLIRAGALILAEVERLDRARSLVGALQGVKE